MSQALPELPDFLWTDAAPKCREDAFRTLVEVRCADSSAAAAARQGGGHRRSERTRSIPRLGSRVLRALPSDVVDGCVSRVPLTARVGITIPRLPRTQPSYVRIGRSHKGDRSCAES